jgi:hypothetical protein
MHLINFIRAWIHILVVNCLAVGVIAFVGAVLIIHSGTPPLVVRVVLTLITVPPAAAFICYWIHRRIYGRARRFIGRHQHVYYELRSIDTPPAIQACWDGFGSAAEFVDGVNGVGAVSRRLVIATVGCMAWSVLGFVPFWIGFIVLLAMLCMAFPLRLRTPWSHT